MNFIEMKESIKPLLKQFCGVSDEEAEDIILNADEFDGGIMGDVLQEFGEDPEPASVDIEGLTICDKEFSINVSRIDENEYLTLLTFGGCTDVTAANMAMSEYEQSSLSTVLGIENEVEAEGDPLVFSCSFNAENGYELRNNLTSILEVLQNDEFKELLFNIIEHFE